MVEGSDMSLDTAMYIQSEGGERLLVPVRPSDPAQNGQTKPAPGPNPVLNDEYQEPSDLNMNQTDYVPPPKKNRWFYMK